jgi:hypothetical protein
MRVENTLMDVYVNGTITSTKFTAVPKQNYNDVQICQNGGFEGNLSNLRFSHALSAFEINNIVVRAVRLSWLRITLDDDK